MRQPKDDVKRAVLLLRFHTQDPIKPYPVYETYASIAKSLGITYNQVQHICRFRVGPKSYSAKYVSLF
jgi:hypothetical protein